MGWTLVFYLSSFYNGGAVTIPVDSRELCEAAAITMREKFTNSSNNPYACIRVK